MSETASSTDTLSTLAAVEIWESSNEADWSLLSSQYTNVDSLVGSADEPEAPQLALQVANARQPEIIEFTNGNTPRSESALADGIRIVVGWPVLVSEKVTSVVLLFLRSEGTHPIGVERWMLNAVRREVELDKSSYTMLELFGGVSQRIRFPTGSGLPGLISADQTPRLLQDIDRQPNFIRAATARDEGLSFAMGLPFTSAEGKLSCALILLAARQSPLAKVCQVWLPHKSGTVIELAQAATVDERFSAFQESAHCKPFEGIVGKAWRSRTPILKQTFEDEPKATCMAATECELSWMFAFPIIVGTEVSSVCLFMD